MALEYLAHIDIGVAVSTFYLILSILSLIMVTCAVVQGRKLYMAMVPYFFAGWLTGELAIWHLILQVAFTLLMLVGGYLDGSAGTWGLGLFLLSWLGLIYLHLQATNTGAILFGALRGELGADYRSKISTERQGVLRDSIETEEWMRPFKMPRPGVKVHRNISYGDAGERNLLDIYQPEQEREGGYPVLLQVHGGGWIIGEKHQQALPLMYHLAQRGWLCVAINYRLSPAHTFPAHIIDVKKSIAWIREHAAEYGANADFLAITGGSAGGHLSSLAALTGNKADWQPDFEDADTSIQAGVPIYGVYDFLDRSNIRGEMSMEPVLEKYVFQNSREEGYDARDDGSPLQHVSEDAPPMFVLQGTHDSLVWVEEAHRFVENLKAASKNAVVYGELPGAQHAFEVFHSVRTDHTVNAITDFLEWAYATRS